MKKIALIPARYGATRLPGKLMRILGDEPVIIKTYRAVQSSGLFDEVAIVTDADVIETAALSIGGKVYRSTKIHNCGTDRIAEYAHFYAKDDIIVNVQGDEPFVNYEILQSLILALLQDESLAAASPVEKIVDRELLDNPNAVKVVMDAQNHALLFSRSKIPYQRAENVKVTYYKHIGIYAFRQWALMKYAALHEGILEQAEMLEGLRFIENGLKIKMVFAEGNTQGIDTAEDLEKANQWIQNRIEK